MHFLCSSSRITVAWRLAVGLEIYILVGNYLAMALARWIIKLYRREMEENGSTFFFQKPATLIRDEPDQSQKHE
jgi:hypothetical protein